MAAYPLDNHFFFAEYVTACLTHWDGRREEGRGGREGGREGERGGRGGESNRMRHNSSERRTHTHARTHTRMHAHTHTHQGQQPRPQASQIATPTSPTQYTYLCHNGRSGTRLQSLPQNRFMLVRFHDSGLFGHHNGFSPHQLQPQLLHHKQGEGGPFVKVKSDRQYHQLSDTMLCMQCSTHYTGLLRKYTCMHPHQSRVTSEVACS